MSPKHRLHYVNLYNLLNLSNEATLDELNEKYRRMVGRLHPDRLQSDPALAAVNEVKLRHLNDATRELRSYHRDHGRLPLQRAKSMQSSNVPVWQTSKAYVDDDKKNVKKDVSHINMGLRILVIILASWSAWLIWD